MPKSGFTARKIAAAGIVVAGMCLVTAILVLGSSNQAVTHRDFIQYWALEQQLARHANPYDPAAILRIERSIGMEEPGVLISPSPPVGLAFALPLGWVSAKNGLALWMLLEMICTGISVWLLWVMHGRPGSRWHLIALGFPPVLWCLIAGQLGIFFLLEVVLFLYWIGSRPWLAGAALALCPLKPHLFLPWALVLVLWSLSRRKASVLAGFAAGFAVSCGLTLWIDPRVWQQYALMMRASPIMTYLLPTASVKLRFLVDQRAHWIEFVPETCACLWAVWYFLKRREQWDWSREGLLVLLVSLACAPYSWYCDQALLFPAVLVGIYASERSVVSLALFSVIAGAGLISFIAQIPMTSAFYIWTAPAWLLWYLYATRRANTPARLAEDGIAAAV